MADAAMAATSALGFSYVGLGINLLNWTLDDVPDGNRIVAATSSNVNVIPLGTATSTTTTSQCFTSFLHAYADSVGVSASYGPYSASVQAKCSGADFQSVDSQFASFTMVVSGLSHDLGTMIPTLQQNLTPDAKAALASSDYAGLFQTYGTHLVTKVHVGAMMRYFCWSKDTVTTSSSSFAVDAQASYNGIMAKVGVSGSHSNSSQSNAQNVNASSQLTVSGGSSETRAMLSACEQGSYSAWANTITANPGFLSFGPNSLVPIWLLAETPAQQEAIYSAYKLMVAQNPTVRTISATGATANHPTATASFASLPDGGKDYRLLSGGAIMNSPNQNNFITGSYPGMSLSFWQANGKDQDIPDPCTATAYLTALYDPEGIWETKLFEATSASAHHPTVKVFASAGWAVTGGGANANYSGSGQLLTASYPAFLPNTATTDGWVAASKDHQDPDIGTVTAFAIGLRCLIPGVTVTTTGSLAGSPAGQNPQAEATVAPGQTMVGGGAFVNYGTQPGNLLVSSYPNQSGFWSASANSNQTPSTASITTAAIGLSISLS